METQLNKVHFHLFFLFFIPLLGNGQEYLEERIWSTTEKPNAFFMTDDSILFYVKNNFDICLGIYQNETVVLKFVIEKDGSTSQMQFITDNDKKFRKKVSHLFSELPPWIPAKQNGSLARSYRFLLFKCSNQNLILPPYATPKHPYDSSCESSP